MNKHNSDLGLRSRRIQLSASWLPWEVRKFNWVHGLIVDFHTDKWENFCQVRVSQKPTASTSLRQDLGCDKKKGSTECSWTFLGPYIPNRPPFPYFPQESPNSIFFLIISPSVSLALLFLIAHEHKDRKHSCPEIPWLLSCSLTPTHAFLPF